MPLIVGLGNPGKEYDHTRHNVGFDVLDELAVRLGWTRAADDFARQARSKFEGLVLDGPPPSGSQASGKVLLLKPMTYMNVSGRSVLAAMQFYQFGLEDLVVVLDDLALPCGQIRLRAEGSSGGHNGLKDIERVLGTSKYPRLRVGIDAPPPRIPGRDYVLQHFTGEQQSAMLPPAGAIAKAAQCLLTWLTKGLTLAMNQHNTREESKT